MNNPHASGADTPAFLSGDRKSTGRVRLLAALLAVAMLLSVLSGCGAREEDPTDSQEHIQMEPSDPAGGGEDEDDAPENLPQVTPLARYRLLNFSSGAGTDATASVAPYTLAEDLSNVENLDRFYLSDAQKQMLAENQFFVGDAYGNEFFELYENNRYYQIPNFITVDSLMHTYHLYFSFLLNRTEKSFLSKALSDLSKEMLKTAQTQYQTLRGTEWEEPALRNVAFFAVGAKLLDESVQVPDAAASLAGTELDRIMSAQMIDTSPLTGTFMDYTQYIPRGYYAGDPVLEAYFRAMMWYGQVNFAQDDEILNRAALLMTLAMVPSSGSWERLYAVTSFFAGASDDLGYYEYLPAIEAAYGKIPEIAELKGDEKSFETFEELVEQMAPPAINSVPVMDDPNDPSELEDVLEDNKGFRFMGQRFTIDAAIMQRLVYRAVKENSQGDKRMLPDALDVPAALGSDAALEILQQQGVTEFPNYMENLETMRTYFQQAPASTWSTSLSSSWLYTLLPVLEPKGSGYPAYMTGPEWQKKCLETFTGSYTELKHDTVLYAKQMVAEMGGGPEEILDDRGYVDPEVEVYRRFASLAEQTSQGLDQLGFLSNGDRENLARLTELAQRLATISEKELRNETLTDEEYELIRSYGGTLEHFWIEAVKDRSESPYLETQEIPSSLVTDIATDPNGTVLQVANGRPMQIVVVVPVDGGLRLASGTVYDFYQFTQPMDQRLTDKEWRQMIGQWAGDDGNYNWGAQVERPQWTQSYRCLK